MPYVRADEGNLIALTETLRGIYPAGRNSFTEMQAILGTSRANFDQTFASQVLFYTAKGYDTDGFDYVPNVDTDTVANQGVVYSGGGIYNNDANMNATQVFDNDLGSFFHDLNGTAAEFIVLARQARWCQCRCVNRY